MKNERWRQVEQAFVTALELPEAGRREYLDRLDTQIRGEVEGMLRGHEEADRLLPTNAGGRLFTDAADQPASGTQIGAYRLLEVIGHGGMGIVYRAERADDQSRKQVALKLVRTHAFALAGRIGEALARFRVEQQILALLTHPNIVRLLDAGVTAEGLPYFVMQMVEGQPITQYCERNAVDIPARLKLFEKVCSAIDHAHRHQVIHRDIKPANILVTAGGDVKVLDFGIAKMLLPLGGEGGESVTTRFVPMTPDYASPEHLKGLPVTTASDIYSLGLVLYELITGSKARPGPAKPMGQGRDLDSIFLKATGEDPSERYATPGELARDLGLYLAGSPVMARQATLWYIAGKAMRRNRGKVAAGLVMALLAGGTVLWQSRQLGLERQRRYEQMREVVRTMIVDTQNLIRDLPGTLEARAQLIRRAIGYLEVLSKETAGDAQFTTELGTAYLQMASLQSGSSVSNLGDERGASDSLEKARLLAESTLRRNPRYTPASRLLASYWQQYSTLPNLKAGDQSAAAQKAFDIRRELADSYPGDFHLQKEYAAAFQFLAMATADPVKSEALFAESADRIDQLLKSQPNDLDLLRNSSLAAKQIGGRYESRSQWDEALKYHQRALRLDKQLLDAHPRGRTSRMDVSVDWCSVGDAQRWLNRLPEAAEALRNCVDIREQLVAEEPKDVYARFRLSYAHMLLASMWTAAGKPSQALASSDRSIQLAQETIRAAPSTTESTRVPLAYAYWFRARALETLGKRSSACSAFREAVARFDRQDQRVKTARRRWDSDATSARQAKARCER